MEQLGIFDIKPQEPKGYYFFRLDFGIKSRYSKSFELRSLPSKDDQELMVQIYFSPKNEEILDLKEKYGFTGFELCQLKE